MARAFADAGHPGWERARAPRRFSFPDDHGPHRTFSTEWWYFTGNVVASNGRRFGYQLTFFRSGLHPDSAGVGGEGWRSSSLCMAHFALSDIDQRRFLFEERLEREALGLAGFSTSPFSVYLGSWRAASTSETSFFPLRLNADGGEMAIDFRLDSIQPFVLQGEGGLSIKSADSSSASYYYSCTRIACAGTVTINGETFAVEGSSWLDREWSSGLLKPSVAGWDWFSLQLDSGGDLMVFRLRDTAGATDYSHAVLLQPDGRRRQMKMNAMPLRTWRNPGGTAEYPVEWLLVLDSKDSLRVRAAYDAQELATRVRYWEGSVEAAGTVQGQLVKARGYLEMTGYDK